VSQKPIPLAEIRKRLDRISSDLERSTVKGFLSAARDLKFLESELGDATQQPPQLLIHISSARGELGLGKVEAAQDLIARALFFTEPGKTRPSSGSNSAGPEN
jgi:hypothetical protein